MSSWSFTGSHIQLGLCKDSFCVLQDIMEFGNLKPALSEIKYMLSTPIKAYNPNDVVPCSDDSKSIDKHSTDDSESSSKGSVGDRETNQGGVSSKGNSKVSSLLSNSREGDSIPEGDLPGQLTRVLGKCE